MPEDVRMLLDDYVARFERGEHPDPLAYRERAGQEWPGLALAIDRYLVGASPPAPSAVDVEAMRLLVAGTPPLLGIRTRRGVPRAEVIDRLLRRFAFPDGCRRAVALRYHQFETGLLSLTAVDEGVFEEVAAALGIARDEVLPWRAPRVASPVYARGAAVASQGRERGAEMALPALAHADPDPRERVDEVDRIFGLRAEP